MAKTALSVSIVVPVFNEEAVIVELVERLRAVAQAAGWDAEILLVLDGCTDGSRERVTALGHPEVKVIDLPENRGQHAALFEGLKRARGAVVAMLDADLQNPPEELPRLVAAVENGAEAACGVRRGRRDPAWRQLVSAGFNAAMSVLLTTPVRDIGCMLRAYDRAVIDRFLASREAPLFLPVQLGRRARTTKTLDVAHAPRRHGDSRYDGKALVRLLWRAVRSRVAPGDPQSSTASEDRGE